VLLGAGYWYFFGSDSGQKGAEEHVQSAMSGLEANQSIENVKKDIREALEKLPETEGESSEITEARQKLTDAQTTLVKSSDDAAKTRAITDLRLAGQKLQSLTKPTTPPGRSLKEWLVIALLILVGLVVAFLLTTAAMYIWKRAWRNVEINVAQIVMGHLGSERSAQPDFTDKLTSLSSAQKETNSNLLDLHTEVRTMAKMMRESLADRNDRRPTTLPISYPVQSDGSIQKDEPEFPVSVNEYLGKMSRYANAVKLDFQNGILVNDPDKKDELFLIRDSRQPEETKSLFLVPGAAQFHNKQDFEIYYAKYYECAKPAMGDVWIIGPAVVEKVPGGWQLREKGMLEVR